VLKFLPWHPFLLAIYPALHLLARNAASVRPQAAVASMLWSLAAVLVVWAATGLVLRSRDKGALLTALAAILFFGHGHVLRLVGGGDAAAWLLVALGGAALLAAGFLLARWRGDARPWNLVVTSMALVAVVVTAVPIIVSEARPPQDVEPAAQAGALRTPLGYLPDIYIVTLDAFGRADVLRDDYGVDLSGFTAFLEERGFVVPARATANYNQTSLSLAALLNADYVQNLMPQAERTFRNRKGLGRLVSHNRVLRTLRASGYSLVTIAGGSELSVQANPDVVYDGGTLNEFQSTLLATTPLPLVAAALRHEGAGAIDPYAQHRERLLYQLEKLPHVAALPGPKVVFAHVLAPHPPFVFAADGSPLTPDYEFNVGERYAWNGYVEGYTGQATWLIRQLRETVDGILAFSRRPPVILLLGDHGPASRWIANWKRTGSFETDDPATIAERMAIFLALYVPEGDGGAVYPEITPVNIFPLVFERCFDAPARLQRDHSFFSTYDQWSLFRNVDDITGLAAASQPRN